MAQEPTNHPLLITNMTNQPRCRLANAQNAGACNNTTNFYCWMSCLDIPNANTAQAYINENYELYCLDPAVLAATLQVSKAVEPRNEAGATRFATNTSCLGMWQPQVPNVPSQQVIFEIKESTYEPPVLLLMHFHVHGRIPVTHKYLSDLPFPQPYASSQ
jgi:hypothetical protein